MQRFKNFVATGLSPNGRLYAGDLLTMQDLVAALSDFTQTVDLGTVRVGDTGLAIVKYGTGEFRLTGHVRTDGIVRALGGLYAGAFTTTQRNAISAGSRPYGLVILNTTTNQYEWNIGTDATPNWVVLGTDPASVLSVNAFNAKGDLLVGSADNAFGILSVAANGKWPRSDSASTLGIKWDDILIYATESARPSASLHPGKFFFASDKNTLDFSTGGVWQRLASSVGSTTIVTTLPPSPVDGQRIVYKAATDIYWELMWVAVDSHWVYLGGPPMKSFVAAQEGQANTTSYGNLSTTGPQLTTPEAGFYQIRQGADVEMALSSGDGYMSYTIGGSGASDADAVKCRSDSNKPSTFNTKRDKTLGKNVALVAKYRNLVAGAGSDLWSNRWMEIEPQYITP